MTKHQADGNRSAKMAGSRVRLRIRLMFDDLEIAKTGIGDGTGKSRKAMFGPGKADLLEQIGKTGSIASAGRAMGMSYKRAWMLVETMNAIFAEPLVISSRGGAAGGGAELTETGQAVLSHYRALEKDTLETGNAEIEAICSLLKQKG